MIRKVVCNSCGVDFEAVSLPNVRSVFCPNCATEVNFDKGKEIVEIGGYHLHDMLGQGGMGQVYRASDKSGRMLALKVMAQDSAESPELRERFAREMSIMGSLHHENIVDLIDRGETSTFQFFVMELVEGTTLRHLIREGPISSEKIAQIAIQTFKALGYAHSMGIIHRDIKPENILFDKNGIVKVTDFGLARKVSFGSSDRGVSLTATNAFMGTENYMSPEQKINPKAVSHKTDIYSFGVVVYEMLTGGMLPMGIFQPPSFYKPLDPFWDSFTFRLLDINPEMRPDNCEEIILEINQFLSSPPNSPEGSQVSRVAPPSRPAGLPGQIPTRGRNKNDSAAEMLEVSQRMRNRLEDLFNEAHKNYEAGNYEVALELWDNALPLTTTDDDRQGINEWKNLCLEKLNRKPQAKEELVVLLCPGCHKPFHVESGVLDRFEFSCPSCAAVLQYDKVRKCVTGQKTPPAAVSTGQPERPKGESPERTGARSGWFANLRFWLFYLLLGLIAFDWYEPGLLDRAIAIFLNLVPSSGSMMSPAVLVLYLRFIGHIFLILIGCSYLYSLYGSPESAEKEERTKIQIGGKR